MTMAPRLVAPLILLAACMSSSAALDREGDLEHAFSTELRNGPLIDRSAHGYLMKESHAGFEMTDGLEVLALDGDQPAVIDGIFIDESDGVQMIGALIAGPDRRGIDSQLYEVFPPVERFRRHLDPAVGTVIEPVPPGERVPNYQLIIGLRVTTDDWAARDWVQIQYTVGQDRFVERLDAQILFCPKSLTTAACRRRAGI